MVKLTSILEQGVASGEFDVRDPNMAALAIIGSVSWSTFWYHPDGRLTIADITQNMTHLLMGLAGLKRA